MPAGRVPSRRAWATRGALAAMVAAGAVAVGVGAGRGGADEVSPEGGAVELVAANQGGPLAEGDWATEFTLDLPDGAACRGDSTNGGYRVQSFMVPASVDVGSLAFSAAGPEPKGSGADTRRPLYRTDTTTFVNAATNLAEEPGGPGEIINIPNFTLAILDPAEVAPGPYKIGLACTKGPIGPDQVDGWWETTLELGSSAGGAAGPPDRWTAAAGSAVSAGAAPDAADGASGADGTPDGATASPETDESGADTIELSSSAAAASEPDQLGGAPTLGFPGPGLVLDVASSGGWLSAIVLLLAVAMAGRIAVLLRTTATPRTDGSVTRLVPRSLEPSQ